MKELHKRLSNQTGFSVMEVLIAIIIFAIGMIAMAQLQGTLTRSSANANVRTVAANIGEETIEAMRGFARLSTDPNNLLPAYADIVSTGGVTVNRGGIDYTVTTTVTDMYYDIISDSFMDAASYFALSYAPTDAFSDYKRVTVNVAWDDTRPWLIDENQSFTAASSITLSTAISSMTSGGNSQVATQDETEFFLPTIDYSPGENPDIISLKLAEGKFKESLTPEPEVYRTDTLMETRFDVVTYSQTDAGALFLRREEFMSVSCECKLKAPPGDPEDAGRRPTIWAGDEYEDAEFVNKPYGISNLNVQTQSAFCDVCCQDHHDGGSHEDDAESATTFYGPFPNVSRQYWETGSFAGDHKHYYPNSSGVLQVASADGALYLESCALVRKDGFMRVIQDFRQEGVNGFPQDVLDDGSEVDVYSDYVTGAVSVYAAAVSPGYETNPPLLTSPAVGEGDADLWSNYTTLPLGSLDRQQLRSRGIYIGYISNDLQYVIDCLDEGRALADCESGDVKLDQTGSTNALELLPFFDVQLTKLSRWNESPINNPVDTTNEPIITGNLHSRGVAFSGGRQGRSLVMAKGHPGNIGLTDIDPIEPYFTTTKAEVVVDSTLGTTGYDPSIAVITGTITNAVGGAFKVTSVTVTSTDAICDRTPDGFVCAITGVSPTIKVAGYGKATKTGLTDRRACSLNMVKLNESFTDVNPWAIFSLANLDQGFLYNITITTATVCPTVGIGG